MKRKENRVIVTTSRGVRVECLPIFEMMDGLLGQEREKLMREREVPPIPTYTFKDVSEDEIERPHDAVSIQDPKTSEEAREAWDRRLSVLAEIDEEARARSEDRGMRIMATRGLRVLDMPPEEEWIEGHEYLGFEVPDDPRDRAVHYFRYEVLGRKEDGEKLFLGVCRASGLDEEVLKRVEDGFRPEVGRPEGSDAGEDS